ncbi:MAG TPA: VanZ family protein [Verrucomicrobiae bacterium]|nr:VanZ family protein [Verrucomicrobiae bacterium]
MTTNELQQDRALGRNARYPSMTPAQKTVFWLPATLWAGLILFLSMITRLGPADETTEHKIGHIAVYLTLAGTVMWALHRGHALRLSKSLALAILITAAYAASDEWHQSFVPGRHCRVSDVVLDTSAGAVAVLAYYIRESLRPDNKKPFATPERPSMALGWKLAHWIPSLLCAGLIFYLSSQSKLPEVRSRFPDADQVERLGFYFVFWCFLLLPFRYAHRLSLAKAIVGAFLITSAYGAAIELHQRYSLNTTNVMVDWAADTFGGFIAAAAYWVYETRPRPQRNL